MWGKGHFVDSRESVIIGSHANIKLKSIVFSKKKLRCELWSKIKFSLKVNIIEFIYIVLFLIEYLFYKGFFFLDRFLYAWIGIGIYIKLNI